MLLVPMSAKLNYEAWNYNAMPLNAVHEISLCTEYIKVIHAIV